MSDQPRDVRLNKKYIVFYRTTRYEVHWIYFGNFIEESGAVEACRTLWTSFEVYAVRIKTVTEEITHERYKKNAEA